MMATGGPQGSTSPGAPASGPHNQADVRFATDMIPHHSQAVAMAEMAATKATNSQVKMLAADIKAAQDPEMTQMAGWLTGWGQPVPGSWISGVDHNSMSSGMGMMSDGDMSTLDVASGAGFDRMWVEMMVQHHTGAVEMAKTELSGGQNTDAKTLAQSIVTSQTAQITQLQAVLSTLPTT